MLKKNARKSKLGSKFTFLPSHFLSTSASKGTLMHFHMCSNLMLAFLILETYLKYVAAVFGEREVEKKSLHSRKQPNFN